MAKSRQESGEGEGGRGNKINSVDQKIAGYPNTQYDTQIHLNAYLVTPCRTLLYLLHSVLPGPFLAPEVRLEQAPLERGRVFFIFIFYFFLFDTMIYQDLASSLPLCMQMARKSVVSSKQSNSMRAKDTKPWPARLEP